MKRRTLQVRTNVNNEDIQVGHKVKLINDETLTSRNHAQDYDLMRKYPMLGIHKPLADMIGTVIETGIRDMIVQREDKFVTYLQDIVIDIEGNHFRTSSGCVKREKTLSEIANVLSDVRDSVHLGRAETRFDKAIADLYEIIERQ